MVYFNGSVSDRCWPNVELVSSTLGQYRFDVVPVLDWYWIGIGLDRYLGSVLVLYWTGTGSTLGLYWTGTGSELGLYWAGTSLCIFGPVRDQCWASTGCFLDKLCWFPFAPRFKIFIVCNTIKAPPWYHIDSKRITSEYVYFSKLPECLRMPQIAIVQRRKSQND